VKISATNNLSLYRDWQKKYVGGGNVKRVSPRTIRIFKLLGTRQFLFFISHAYGDTLHEIANRERVSYSTVYESVRRVALRLENDITPWQNHSPYST
jgi:hypothetical protein